jgi:hypothetical protein
MKKQTHMNRIPRSSLALILAMASWLPVAATAADDKPMKTMKDGKHQMMLNEANAEQPVDEKKMMMQRCQSMKEQKEKMMADMKAQDADLTEQVAKMNSAPKDKKIDLMAAVVTRMVEQRTAMNVRKEKMQGEMMKHMMQQMQMGKESMEQCPMMKGMKAMKDGKHQMMLNEANAKQPMDGKKKMMQRCQGMKEQKEKMMADMKAQDADLTEQVAKMNSAPKDKKIDLMAAVVTRMVEQRTAMNVRKEKMQGEMMKHMMQQMQMGKESMEQCPMMKGMKAMNKKSDDAQK